jgi:hypothetical protein
MSGKQHTVTLTAAEEFYYEHAGWSFDPALETSGSGRTRNAILLAQAAEWLAESDAEVHWMPDDDQEAARGDGEEGTLWVAVLYNGGQHVLASLGGVGFSSGAPWGAPHAKVVEAELAVEALRYKVS